MPRHSKSAPPSLALSAPLPLTPRPFAAIAERVGVSEGQVLDRLNQLKRASYRACYDAACQIELGKALAAQKVLAAAIESIKTGDGVKVA
mgnify:CR=1 FL=1